MIISIDYDEGNQSSYRAVIAKEGNVKKVFDCGDPELDFQSACYWAHKNSDIVMLSSSCDQFVYDGINYGWKTVNGITVIYRLSQYEKEMMFRPV